MFQKGTLQQVQGAKAEPQASKANSAIKLCLVDSSNTTTLSSLSGITILHYWLKVHMSTGLARDSVH